VFDDDVAYPIVFGKVVSNLREQHRPVALKQAELAALAGVNQGTLSRIEAGHRVDVITARRIAYALGLTYEQLSARVEVVLAQTREYAAKTMPKRSKPAPRGSPVANVIGVVGAFALVALAIDAMTPTPRRRTTPQPRRRRRS
jgi:transcriptional regulator with XRE-family HTH domain